MQLTEVIVSLCQIVQGALSLFLIGLSLGNKSILLSINSVFLLHLSPVVQFAHAEKKTRPMGYSGSTDS